jgi:hypothetical protein
MVARSIEKCPVIVEQSWKETFSESAEEPGLKKSEVFQALLRCRRKDRRIW